MSAFGQGVAEVDAPRRQPLGPGGAHVVGVEDAEHLDPHDAGQDRRRAERECDHRQDVGGGAVPPGDRQPAEGDAEDEDEADTEQEVGDRGDERRCRR